MKHGTWFSAKYRITAVVFLLTFALSLLNSVPLFSQAAAARISGTITDSSGGAVAGATVTVTDVDRGTTRNLTTEETGSFNAPGLLPGNYRVRAAFKGFKATERQNIKLEVGQEIRVDLTLQPGEQEQTVTVTEEMPLVETTNAELGGTIQNAVVNDLPLNGRNFQNLLTMRPGVTIYPGGGGWTQSSNGMRPHDNMYMVEGVDSNDPYMGQSIMNTAMASGDAGTILPIEAINEFRTVQNPRAEYGWKPGAVVSVGVKSGTNTIHGSAYAYGRHDSLDAVDVFTQRTPHHLIQYGASVGGPIKKDKLFFFGNYESQTYSIAAPFEHKAPDTSATATDPVLSLVGACKAVMPNVTELSARLAGLDTSCNPTSSFPGLFPVTASSGTFGGNTLFTGIPSTNTIYAGVGKLDYHASDKHSLSGVFFYSPGAGVFVDDTQHQVDPRWITAQTARAIVGSGSWTFSPNSTVVSSLRVGYAHYQQRFSSPDANVPASDYGFYTGVVNPVSFGLPRIRFGGFGNYQLGGTWPKFVGPDAVTNIVESISWLRGNHSLKFGGEFLLNHSINMATNNTKGPLGFAGDSSLQNFFTGTMANAQIAAGNFLRNISTKGYALFVQDDWRVTRTLTVTAGVRYEYNGVISDNTDGTALIANWSPVAGLEQVGVGGYTRIYNPDYNNFSPRLGFAWDVGGNGKTVVRGSVGVIYEQGSYDSFMAINNNYGVRSNPTGVPIYTAAVCPDGAASYGIGLCGAPALAGGTITAGTVKFTGAGLTNLDTRWALNAPDYPLYAANAVCGDGSMNSPDGIKANPCTAVGIDQHLRTPYVTTWSLGIQRAISNTLSLDVSYVGNHAAKLVGLTNLNAAPVGTGYAAAIADCEGSSTCLQGLTLSSDSSSAIRAAQPYVTRFPYLNPILWLSNNNISNYNALQVALTQHTWHGLSYVAGYTFSHALAMSGDNWRFATAVSGNPRELYGSTAFDVRHRFTIAATYAIPGVNAPAQLLKGWSLNSVVTLMSAMPWGVNDVTNDLSGSGEGGCCANAIPTSNGISGGEMWNFYGNPGDFYSSMKLVGYNDGEGGLPYSTGAQAIASTGPDGGMCLAKATAVGDLAIASLHQLGCYVSPNGNSVLIPQAFGSLGNTGPFRFRGPAFYNVDFSITKVTKIGERLSAQFRAEFFNIFNHPNIANPFGGPAGVPQGYTDPSFSQGVDFGFARTTPDVAAPNPILGTGAARAVQLGLKLIF